MTGLRVRTAICVALLTASMVTSGCAATAGPGGDANKVVTYNADYATFDSSASLLRSADLVVLGTVAPGSRVQRMIPLPAGTDAAANPGGPAPAEADNPVQTVFQVQIAKVFKGAAKPEDTVEVGQLGGELDGVTYVSSDAPSLEPGKSYLLLLATFDGRPAVLVNPVQGQYLATGTTFLARPGNPVKLSLADVSR